MIQTASQSTSIASYVPAQPFAPARLLHSAHAQTIFASGAAAGSLLRRLRRERVETEDGDFFDVDVLGAVSARQPVVVLLHGLESHARSMICLRLLSRLALRGWGAYALNFRGCSGEPNRNVRTYCSGDTDDARALIRSLERRGHRGPRFAIGASLGGNVLLKLLAEDSECGLTAAVGISVPFDVNACVGRIDRPGWGAQLLYRRRLLGSLKTKALLKALRFPHAIDASAVRRLRTVRQFDTLLTAPQYGFDTASDLYAWASSGPRLADVRVPALLLSAEDDPLAPASDLPSDATRNPRLSIVVTPHGGHLGFVAGSIATPEWWGVDQAITYLEHIRAQVGRA